MGIGRRPARRRSGRRQPVQQSGIRFFGHPLRGGGSALWRPQPGIAAAGPADSGAAGHGHSNDQRSLNPGGRGGMLVGDSDTFCGPRPASAKQLRTKISPLELQEGYRPPRVFGENLPRQMSHGELGYYPLPLEHGKNNDPHPPDYHRGEAPRIIDCLIDDSPLASLPADAKYFGSTCDLFVESYACQNENRMSDAELAAYNTTYRAQTS